MLKKRKFYLVNKASKPVSYNYGFFALLAFFILLMSFYLFHFDIILFNYIAFLFLVISVIFSIVSLIMFVRVITTYLLPYAKEFHKFNSLAERRILNKFTPQILAENLKLAVRTKNNGYALPLLSIKLNTEKNGGYLYIENNGMYDKLSRVNLLEQMSGIISRPYEFDSSELVLEGDFVRFHFIDTATSQRFSINNLDDLKELVLPEKSNALRLSKNLVWHFNKANSLTIIAKTGSGKTVFAGYYMARLAQLQGYTVYYNSAKKDDVVNYFSGYSDVIDTTEFLENMVIKMHDRLSIIADKNVANYNMIPEMENILIFIDEIGNYNAQLSEDKPLQKRFNNALRQLAMTGRSAGVHLVLISQYGTTESFVPASVKTNASDLIIILGQSLPSERQYLRPSSEVPDRRYGVGQGLAFATGDERYGLGFQFFEAPLFASPKMY